MTQPNTLTFEQALTEIDTCVMYLSAPRRKRIYAALEALEAAHKAAILAAYIKGHESGYHRGLTLPHDYKWSQEVAKQDYVSDGMPTPAQPTTEDTTQ